MKYCGEDGGERAVAAATSVLEILSEFSRSIESAVIKYDERIEQEARKEALEKKVADRTKKAVVNTPRHSLFKTESAIKRNGDEHNTDHSGSSDSKISKPDVNEKEGKEATIQSNIKKQANDVRVPGTCRVAPRDVTSNDSLRADIVI